MHVLQRDENGLEKCVACFLCAVACPSNCIYIEAAENTETLRISGGERYAKVYNIDYNRCIFCGYCVEACPTDAITHGHGFEVASYNTSTLIYRKERLTGTAAWWKVAGRLFARDDQLFVGGQGQHRHAAPSGESEPVAGPLLRCGPASSADPEKLQPRAAGRAQPRGVLADAAGEGDRVQATHGGGVGADRLSHLVGEHFQGQGGVARCLRPRPLRGPGRRRRALPRGRPVHRRFASCSRTSATDQPRRSIM